MKRGRRILIITAMAAILAAIPLLIAITLMGRGTVNETANDGRLRIVATVFPAYDFARAVAGEEAHIQLLLPPGSESHSYEPTPQDMIAIQNADLLLMNGGESEAWAHHILASIGDGAPRTLAMMDCVTRLAEELSPSMQAKAHAEGIEVDEPELDEHVWTSPKNARVIVLRILDALVELEPQKAAVYQENSQRFLAEVDALDAALEEIVENGERTRIFFGDRFPFRYLAHDYGLSYDAAFPGCSEDSEPSARTIVTLIKEMRRYHIPAVFYIEFSNQRSAKILAEETGASLLLLHSCHNVSKEEMQSGATYLTLMWGNVAALKEALW